MVDIRFHPFAGTMPLESLLLGAGHPELVPGDTLEQIQVTGVDELAHAGPGHIALAANRKYAAALSETKAGVVVIGRALRDKVPAGTLALVADDPHGAFADILDHLYPDDTRAILRKLTDEAGATPVLEADVVISPGAVIGRGAEIGAGTIIGPNAVIGAGVAIGRNAVIGANVTIECSYIGNNVVVHSGARIGCEGFGWLDHGRTNRKIPQLGRVIVQDRVEIGANSTIDRGALGDTVIGEGTKIDNLVQIGHNCQIGRNCLVAAMSGLSGTTNLDDGVLMGGGTGTSGHLTIGAGTVVHGRAAVTKDWPAGSKIAGAPAQDIRDFWRETAALRRLTKGEESES